MTLGWKKLSEHIAYRGYRTVLRQRYQMPNGTEADFEVVANKSFVAIAALTQTSEVVLVEQYRPGPEMLVMSVPEGQIDSQESPEDAARRELMEETGYEAGKVVFLKEIPESYSQTRKMCYLALDCVPTHTQDLDDTEFIRVFTVSLAQFRQMLADTQHNNFNSVDVGFLMLNYLDKAI